jgi:hypothetical protein
MTGPDEFSLVRGGPTHRIGHVLGLQESGWRPRLYKILLLIAVTWLPLFVLCLLSGTALGHRVSVPLLRDEVVFSRFLFVVPLLVLAEVLVEASTRAQVRQLLESEIVPPRARTLFESAKAEASRLRESRAAEGLIVLLAWTLSVVGRSVVRLGPAESNWERTPAGLSSAGWWYMLVSLPVVFFFLLRWLWVFLLWSWFLFRVSRLELDLTPTHPDRAGGLGFLGWGLASFSTVLMAVSAVLAGSFAYEIAHRGSSLDTLKYHVIVFVVLAIAILHAPLLAFMGRLARCRFRGLMDFGALIGFHDRAFDDKWSKRSATSAEGLLGSPDVASLADAALVYEHVERMQLVPWDRKAVLVLAVALLIPMIPLAGTAISLSEILSKLAKFMV